MRKIIISEKAERKLFESLINEEVGYLGDKERAVLDWLNKHYKALEIDKNDATSIPVKGRAVSVLDTNGQITKRIITMEDAFFILQSNFKKILSDKKERDQFLWDTLNKWYH
jgi:hypothetical protein